MEDKLEKIIKEIEGLNALEISQLVKALEEKFGVSAAPVAMAVPAAAAAETAAVEEKSAFDVVLKGGGGQKIQVIKVLREVTGKGLKEAKDLVDAVPQVVKSGVSKNEADELKKKLEEAGATVEIK